MLPQSVRSFVQIFSEIKCNRDPQRPVGMAPVGISVLISGHKWEPILLRTTEFAKTEFIFGSVVKFYPRIHCSLVDHGTKILTTPQRFLWFFPTGEICDHQLLGNVWSD
jgi:hypothetical protein